MGQWFRTRFSTRRRPPAPAPPAPVAPAPPAEPSLSARVAFWRALFRAEAQRSPTVDQVQARDEQAQRRRAAEGTNAIARSIAAKGSWFPHQD